LIAIRIPLLLFCRKLVWRKLQDGLRIDITLNSAPAREVLSVEERRESGRGLIQPRARVSALLRCGGTPNRHRKHRQANRNRRNSSHINASDHYLL